jgi:hypothetical protein
MAGKKPAKPMAGQTKQVALDPAVYGTQIKYMGTKNSPTTCPSCGRQTIRGMVRQKGEGFFCSLVCAKSSS